MFNTLEQLGINFQTQLTKSAFKWCNQYKYDFYFELNNEQYILETHGLQHYEDTSGVYKKTLQEEQENDRVKKELALKNGIKEENYIVIDCRKSELDWIKEHIILEQNILNKLFNLGKIDWIKCGEFALSNRVKEACKYWNSKKYSTTQIGKIMKLHKTTISKYLKQGFKLNWCSYNAQEVMRKSNLINALKNGEKQCKSIEMFKKGVSLGVFKSATYIDKNSEKLFKIKLYQTNISAVCRGVLDEYKGYTFKFS